MYDVNDNDTAQPAASAQPALAWPTFAVTPYRPDGGAELPGVLMLLSALAIFGAVLGFAVHFVSKFFYLIILFPVLIGLAVGFVGVMMVKQGRVRNPWLGALAGFVGGILAMGMAHYFDFSAFRSELASLPPGVHEMAQRPRAEWAGELKDESPADRAEIMEVLNLASIRTLGQFMDYQAHEGVKIGRATSSKDKGINLGYYGSWAYWVIEALIVGGVVLAMVRSQTAEPYCRDCGLWKQPRVLGSLAASPPAAAAAVASGSLNEIVQNSPSPGVGPVLVTAACCAACAGENRVDVKVESITLNKEGKEERKTLAHTCYPGESLPHLTAAFQGQGA